MLGTFPPLFHLLPLPHLPTAQKEKLSPSAESQKSAVCLHPCHRWLQGPSPHSPCSHTVQHRLFLPHSLEVTTHGLCQGVVTCGSTVSLASAPRWPRHCPLLQSLAHRGRDHLNTWIQNRAFAVLELFPGHHSCPGRAHTQDSASPPHQNAPNFPFTRNFHVLG